MSAGREGADRNLSSAAATALFTAQPDGLVQQQPFRINNCCSGGRGFVQEPFHISAGALFFFPVCFLAAVLRVRCQPYSKGGSKKRKNAPSRSAPPSFPPLSLCAAFPAPLASNVAAFNLEIMVTCMCILRVYHCCS